MKPTLAPDVGATPTALRKLRAAYPSLPESYFAFLAGTNGAEGELGIEPGWVVVWPADEALVATDQYQMSEYLPGYFAFGSNGGGERFVFPIQHGAEQCPVFMVPAIGIVVTELQQVAPSFAAFEAFIGRALDEGGA